MSDRKPQRLASDRLGKATGKVRIRIRKAGTKKVVQTIKGDNLLVNNWLTQVLFALFGGGSYGNVTDWQLSQAQLGTSGVAPAAADTTITNPVNVALTATYPASKSIQLDGTLGAAQGNGIVFQEIGLSFAGAGLAARRTFGAVTKSPVFEWDVEWTIVWA